MQTVTNQIKQSMAGSSWIRKMFEKGIELKKRYGADAVCDFSLGNPDVPPPAKTKEILEGLAAKAIEPLGLGYCPNAGCVRRRTSWSTAAIADTSAAC